MPNKYFPIQTQTACQLKWAWSTLYLNGGSTASCHRTGISELTGENFHDFHNTPLKQQERAKMLKGEWPENSCSYCKNIEESGGISDRVRMTAIPGLSPPELDVDPTALVVDPTLVEVYFNNTCNLGCLYCNDRLSSVIEQENLRHGPFVKSGVTLATEFTRHYKNLVPHFWQWFEKNFHKIKRMHVLGGEPFYQQEFKKLLDMIEQYPNADCELNIVTNLMVDQSKLEQFVEKFQKLLVTRKLKRIDITCSIDCWGKEQEYIRWGLNLQRWEDNFNFLLKKKWLTININQTIMCLTIKTMPELLERLAVWRKQRNVGHFFSAAEPAPNYFKTNVLDGDIFAKDIERIMSLMPVATEQDCQAREYMQGILTPIRNSKLNQEEMHNLKIFLDEKDRRRNTNWMETFPWLVKELEHVV
jgi:organic radical activating enzyme